MADSESAAPQVRPGAGASATAQAALAGAAAALGQAPVSVPFAAVLGLAWLFHLVSGSADFRRAATLGWAGGAGYFAVALFWIVEPFLVEAAVHGWMAPFALIGLSGGLALLWAPALGIARMLAGGPLRAALAFAVLLGAAELARSYLLTGFPWALIGHVWIGWAPMHLAAWIGPHGLTLLTTLSAAAAAAAARRKAILVPAALAPFAILYAAGAWMGARPIPTEVGRPVVRLVQPNAAQHLKWDPFHAREFVERQIRFTAAGAADRRPDLIVWPETALPLPLRNSGPTLERVVAAAAGVPVALGIQRLDGPDAYNSLIAIDGSGKLAEIYDKRHLVPFGEYLPGAGILERLGLGLFADHMGVGQGFSAGSGPRLIDPGGLGPTLPLICYEAIFPQDLRGAPARPEWLLQLTNDAWFGRISGPYQHLAQARLRAVEQGLPMIRAANTGISAAIDARGRIAAELPLGEAGYLDVALPAALPPTPYSRTGDLPAAALLLLAFGGLCVARFRERH